MTTLEEKLTELLDSGVSRDEIACAATKLFIQHAPKKTSGWSDYLRRIADYIDNRPKTVELSAKTIGVLIELGDFK